MRNNSLAMLATVTGVGILAWLIGFFDPATCKTDIQQEGWTSCQSIASAQSTALLVLISVTGSAALFIGARNLIQKKRARSNSAKRLTTR